MTQNFVLSTAGFNFFQLLKFKNIIAWLNISFKTEALSYSLYKIFVPVPWIQICYQNSQSTFYQWNKYLDFRNNAFSYLTLMVMSTGNWVTILHDARTCFRMKYKNLPSFFRDCSRNPQGKNFLEEGQQIVVAAMKGWRYKWPLLERLLGSRQSRWDGI